MKLSEHENDQTFEISPKKWSNHTAIASAPSATSPVPAIPPPLPEPMQWPGLRRLLNAPRPPQTFQSRGWQQNLIWRTGTSLAPPFAPEIHLQSSTPPPALPKIFHGTASAASFTATCSSSRTIQSSAAASSRAAEASRLGNWMIFSRPPGMIFMGWVDFCSKLLICWNNINQNTKYLGNDHISKDPKKVCLSPLFSELPP